MDTIAEQVVCDEGLTWGKLKSGLGWINLNKASDTTQHIPITMERQYMIYESGRNGSIVLQEKE